MSDYFSKRKSLKAAVLFMDIRHPLKELDLEIIELCRVKKFGGSNSCPYKK